MPKNEELPGMERPKINEIESAATKYVNARNARMTLTEKEDAAKLNLVTVVQAHEKELENGPDGVKTYRFDDEIVILKPGKINVKVKHASDDGDDEDEVY